MNLKIGFIGLSHLGFIYSLAAAKKKFDVIAFDFDKKIICNLKNKNFHINEPNTKNIINNKNHNIHYTNDIKDLSKCSLIFFSYDTPTDDKMNSNFNFIKEKINKTINSINKKSYFIILSQVLPGFTRNIAFPKKNLFYQVETLIFGKAMERALKPERIIVGSLNKKIPDALNNFYDKFSKKIIITNYETAELSKLSINLYLSSSVALTNTINELSKKIGSDWLDLKKILKLDKRIGKHSYLDPGLGISGGNLERDHINYINLSNLYKTNNSLIKSFLLNSKYQKNNFIKTLRKNISNYKSIFLYGITYKEGTHSTKNSIAIDIINEFCLKYKIYYFDAILSKSLEKNNINLTYVPTERFENISSNVFIFLHKPTPNQQRLFFKTYNNKFVIFDPFNYVDQKFIKKHSKNMIYFNL